MKRLLLHSLLLIALCTLAFACGESPSPTNNTQRYVSLDNAAEAARVTAGAHALAIAVVEDGKLVHTAGFGQRGASISAPVNGNTQFWIGSVTKVLTAIGVLELVDAGKVDLDAPLVKYVPEFTLTANPDEARAITIKELLTHSSGLRDETRMQPSLGMEDAGLDEYLTSKAFADKYSLLAPPGRLWLYSNLGYDLLGLVIERVSHDPYVQYMQEHVFAPLGMTRTTFSADEVIAGGNYATGEYASQEVEPDLGTAAWQRPCGLAFSTAIDLSKLMTFVMDGEPAILSPSMHDKMIKPTFNTELYSNRFQWGLGVSVGHGTALIHGIVDNGIDSVGHGGQMSGNTSMGMAFPSLDLAVVYIVDKQGTYLDSIVQSALVTLGGAPDLPIASWPEDVSHFDRYVGQYEQPNSSKVEVTVVNNKLRVQGLGLDCLLESVAPGSFTCNAATDPMPLIDHYTFLPTAGGNVEYLRSPTWVAKRVPAKD